MKTIKDDRLDIISQREYGNIDSVSLTSLIWANPDTLGIAQTFPEGIDYIIPPITTLELGEDKSRLTEGVFPEELI